MEPRLSLVVIRAANLTRSRRFYESLGLAFREERHGSGPPHLACELGDAVFEIYPSGTSQAPTIGARLGFRIRDIDTAVSCAANLGGAVVSLPQDSPWGRRAVLRDPDGNFAELLEASVPGGKV